VAGGVRQGEPFHPGETLSRGWRSPRRVASLCSGGVDLQPVLFRLRNSLRREEMVSVAIRHSGDHRTACVRSWKERERNNKNLMKTGPMIRSKGSEHEQESSQREHGNRDS
jgi:hypothetical protein